MSKIDSRPSQRGLFILEETARCRAAAARRLRERERNKRYAFGDQWSDLITVDGTTMTEEAFIRESENQPPLKNNIIRRIVRNVLGVGRETLAKRTDLGRHDTETFARAMEEFLIGGVAVCHVWLGNRNGVKGCHIDLVSPSNFFFDPYARDFQGEDITGIGETHNVGFDELCAAFATDRQSYDRLRRIFPPEQSQRCNVVQYWRRERRPCHIVNDTDHGTVEFLDPETFDRLCPRMPSHWRTAWRVTDTWRYYFLSPEGHIIAEGDSPYPDGSHPYIFKAYPFIDGETHSFVGDLIDQQRYTNRLITLYDWIMRASAKGVLLFPEDSLPPHADRQLLVNEWSRHNGVIFYSPKPGAPLPQQISSNATNIGITELLQIQLKMMEDVSGVNGALQGKLDARSVSGTLYESQTRNAMTALRDLLDSFDSFVDAALGRRLTVAGPHLSSSLGA